MLPYTYSPRYTLVIAFLLIGTALGTFWETRPEPKGAIADVKKIPLTVGAWSAPGDEDIDPNTMAQIKADSYFQRHYMKADGESVDMLVVFRRYGRREFAHRPELCFPAAGYNIIEDDRTTLPYAGHDVPAVHLFADGTHNALPNTTITYFFASGGNTECDFVRQQILMGFERVIPNKNGWTFVRLTTAQRPGDTDPAMVASQQDFMRAMAPELQQVITTDKSGDAMVATSTVPAK